MRKKRFRLFSLCFISFVIFASGCGERNEIPLSEHDFMTGFIEIARGISTLDELVNAYVEFHFGTRESCHPSTLEEDFARQTIGLTHATRYDYLSDFDYLLKHLNEKYNIKTYFEDEIVTTRNVIENFFHMNDLVFNEFLWDGIFTKMIRYEFVSLVRVKPLNMPDWYMGELQEIMQQNLDSMRSNPPPESEIDILLPKTNIAIGFVD